jgi:two-component system, response regulator
LCCHFETDYIAQLVMENGSANGGKIDIVLVEENPAEVSQILNTVKKANICNRIHVLHVGAQVFDFLFRAGPFKGEPPLPGELLILLALKLPDLHGLEVLRKLKADERTKSLAVVILTSSQEEPGVMQSYKMGANACIVKPLDLPKLIEAVAELRLGWMLISLDELGRSC